MTLSNIPISTLLSGLASIGLTLTRIFRDRSPERGLKYFDLDIRADNSLSKLMMPEGARPYTHFIQITNYGREVIEEADYLRPFSVCYSDPAQIVGYAIIHDERAIRPKIYQGKSATEIQIKEVLNPGDTFTIGVLLASTATPDKPVIDCRIKGVRHLKGHLRGNNWLEVLWHLAIHYFAIPLSIIAGLAVGYFIFRATVSDSQPVLDALSLLVRQFGAGVFWGFVIGIVLAGLVELWEYYSFRRQRRFAEDAFRAAAQVNLEKPLNV